METLQFEVLNAESCHVTERALCKFENGLGASILRGYGSISTTSGQYELAIIKYNENQGYELIYPDFTGGDTLHSLSLDQVYEYLEIIKAL